MSASQHQDNFKTKLQSIYKVQDKIEPLIEGLEQNKNGEGVIPQKSMKDYYIKLQTTVDDSNPKKQSNNKQNSSKKQEIEVESIFEKLPDQEDSKMTEINRVLITGGAGVGKSTLLRYFAYKWGMGELWSDRFDYVYRVPLKILLSDDWNRSYGQELDGYELKCLVHYSLKSIAEQKRGLPLKDLVWIDNKEDKVNDRILLLIDGYDEVEHFRKTKFASVFEEIFEFKNIIMTSRPNVINKETLEKFDRKIENTGLGTEGINKYFARYFQKDQEKGEKLQEFLQRNPSIKEICNIPVNIAMLCFIWGEGKSNEALQKISCMSDLYAQVVDHLGFRFYTKKNPKEAQNTKKLESLNRGGSLVLDELLVLQHVAYKGLIGDGFEAPDGRRPETVIIPGMIKKDFKEGVSIQSSINYLKDEKLQDRELIVDSVYQYGLLKVAFSENNNDSGDFQKMSFCFLHLTFQEYLAAQYIAQELINSNKEEQTKIADFIAYHRNEPRYSLILKFIAGIFRATEGKDEKLVRAIQIFWDSIMCNPNGALELGIDAKVNVLMHLLSQAKEGENDIDPRILNQELAVNFIDRQILGGIPWWVKELKESDYISPRIKEGLLKMLLDDNLNWPLNECNKLEEEFEKTFQQKNSSSEENEIVIEEKYESIPMIPPSFEDPKNIKEEIGDATASLIHKFSREEQGKIVTKILQNLRNNIENTNFTRKNIVAMIKIIESATLSIENHQTFLEILLQTRLEDNQGNASLRGIDKTLQACKNPSLLKEIIKKHVRDFKLNPQSKTLQKDLEYFVQLIRRTDGYDREFVRGVVDSIVQLSEKESLQVKLTPGEPIGQLVKEYGSEDPQLFQGLLSKLNMKLSLNFPTIGRDIDMIKALVVDHSVVAANEQILQELVENLLPFVRHDSNYAEAASSIISKISPQLDSEIIKAIVATLVSQIDEIGRFQRLKLIAKACCDKNRQIIPESIQAFYPGLQDTDSWKKTFTVTYITKLAEIQKDLKLSTDVTQTLIPFLSDTNELVRRETFEWIKGFFSANRNMPLLAETIRALVRSSEKLNPYQNTSSKLVIELIKEADIVKEGEMKEVVRTLISIAEESEDAFVRREIALDTLLELISLGNIEEIKELIESLTLKARDAGPRSKVRLSVMILQLEKRRGNNVEIQKVERIIDDLISLLQQDSSSSDSNITHTTAKSILRLVSLSQGNVDIFKKIVSPMIPFLDSNDSTLKAMIIYSLTEIAKMDNYNDNQLLDLIIPTLILYLRNSSVKEFTGIQKEELLGVAIVIGNIGGGENGKEFKSTQKEALYGIANFIGNVGGGENIQLTQEILEIVSGFLTKNLSDSNKREIIECIGSILNAYRKVDKEIQESAMNTVIPLLKNEFLYDNIIFKEIRETLKIISENDSQLSQWLGIVQNLLEKYLKDPLDNYSLIQYLKSMVELEGMYSKANVERTQALLAIFQPFLLHKDEHVKQQTWSFILKLIKMRDYKDPHLIKTLRDLLSSRLLDETFPRTIPEGIRTCFKISEDFDKSLMKDSVFALLPKIKDRHFGLQGPSLVCIFELLKMYDDMEDEFIQGVFEEITLAFDQFSPQDLSNCLQNLNGVLLSDTYLFRKYLEHSNLKIKSNFMAGVSSYFKKYLERFKILDELVNSHQNIAFKEINKKLFNNLLSEEICLKIGSDFNGSIVTIKDLLANEIDDMELRQGIQPLKIAFLTLEKLDQPNHESEHELLATFWDVLKISLKHLTEEKLKWIVDNYSKLVILAPSVAKTTFSTLYHQIIEDSTMKPMNGSMERLITWFIYQGLTTSLTNQGEIIYEGAKYKIKGDSKFILERIARMVILQGQDLLARQYKTNIQIFAKSFKEGGMQEAAVDKEKVESLVDKRYILRNDYWLLSSLRQLNTASEVILLEQRSAFGNRVVYKIESEGQRFQELNENLDLKDVFGSYKSGTMYSGRFKILTNQEGQDMIKNGPNKIDILSEDRVELYYQQELLGGGQEDRLLRMINQKQDNPLRSFEAELDKYNLQSAEKEALRAYHEGFLSTFSSTYTVAIIISSGRFTLEPRKEDEFSPVSLFTTLVALVPIVGDKLSEYVKKVASKVADNEVQNQAVLMKDFAVDVVDLSDRVSKIARDRISKTKKRKEIIEAKDQDPQGRIAEIKGMVMQKIEEMKQKAREWSKIDNLWEVEIERSPAFRLGEIDANQMIQNWFKFSINGGNVERIIELKREKFIETVAENDNNDSGINGCPVKMCSIF